MNGGGRGGRGGDRDRGGYGDRGGRGLIIEKNNIYVVHF